MTEEERSQDPYGTLDREQLLGLLKETLKQGKSLQTKNTKLETKYVELFKEQKALKKDHNSFLGVFKKCFSEFAECPVGNYEPDKIEEWIQVKDKSIRTRVNQLQATLEKSKDEITLKLSQEFQLQLTQITEASKKQMQASVKEIETLKKMLAGEMQTKEEMESVLGTKRDEIAKLHKQKLKLEHAMNNLRRKEIEEELDGVNHGDQIIEKGITERNEFLSLRQQVEGLLSKRDELRRGLKVKEQENVELSKAVAALQEENINLKTQLEQSTGRLSLLKENLHQYEQKLKDSILSQQFVEITNQDDPPDGQSIPREYFKNVFVRYIKTECGGELDQSLTLLEILTNLLKFNREQMQLVGLYRAKKSQWWNLY